MVNTHTEKNNISEFEITDNEEMLIAVRTNEQLISVNRIELKCKLLVDAKTKPCINSFSAFQSHDHLVCCLSLSANSIINYQMLFISHKTIQHLLLKIILHE